jgi:hypothetical protein
MGDDLSDAALGFHSLLAEPIIQQVMKADKVDERDLVFLLERTAAQMRNWPQRQLDKPVDTTQWRSRDASGQRGHCASQYS